MGDGVAQGVVFLDLALRRDQIETEKKMGELEKKIAAGVVKG